MLSDYRKSKQFSERRLRVPRNLLAHSQFLAPVRTRCAVDAHRDRRGLMCPAQICSLKGASMQEEG
jgi:hypothetical protein